MPHHSSWSRGLGRVDHFWFPAVVVCNTKPWSCMASVSVPLRCAGENIFLLRLGPFNRWVVMLLFKHRSSLLKLYELICGWFVYEWITVVLCTEVFLHSFDRSALRVIFLDDEYSGNLCQQHIHMYVCTGGWPLSQLQFLYSYRLCTPSCNFPSCHSRSMCVTTRCMVLKCYYLLLCEAHQCFLVSPHPCSVWFSWTTDINEIPWLCNKSYISRLISIFLLNLFIELFLTILLLNAWWNITA